MALRNVFSFSDYRRYLESHLKEPDQAWGQVTRLAKAAGCQRSYFSKVLAGNAQLTPAQAHGLALYWKLDSRETEFFLLLLEKERAGSREYREYVERKLKDLRREQEDLSKRVHRSTDTLSTERQSLYYSSWIWSAIHILVSIPGFQTPSSIARKLNLPETQVRYALQTLEAWGCVDQREGKWTFAGAEPHVAKESPFVALHHGNWRQRAVLGAQLRGIKDSLHFTTVQSISKSDFERIKNLLLDFIEKSSEIAAPSEPEELICLNCDFFQV